MQQTINLNDGTSSPTSGVDHIQIIRKSDGSQEIIKNSREKYVGSATESHYNGSAEYQFAGLAMTESISINRYTGLFEINLKSKNYSGLRHVGICKTASKKF